jgi:hypothetical protein
MYLFNAEIAESAEMMEKEGLNRLSGCKVCLLINCNDKVLKNGIRRVVNEFP